MSPSGREYLNAPEVGGSERLCRLLVRIGVACAAITLLLGALAAGSWMLNEPFWRTLVNNGSEMKFNTAVAFTLLAISSLALKTGKRPLLHIASLCAGVVIVLSITILLQYFTGQNFGIDELVFRDTNFVGTTHPGRMAWHSALSFLLLGTAMALLSSRQSSGRIATAQTLALCAAFFPAQGLVGYVYGHLSVLGMSLQTGYMAIPTAVAFITAAVSVLFHAPDRGLATVLIRRTNASMVFRRLLPILIILPVALGWFALTLADGANKPPQYSVAAVAVFTSIMLVALTWLAAFQLSRAEESQRSNDQRLQQFLSLMPAGVYTCDAEGRITFFNRRAAELWGREPKLNSDDDRFCGSYGIRMPDGSLAGRQNSLMAAALRKGASLRDSEVTFIRADGSTFVGSVNIDLLRNDDRGAISGGISVFYDITERKQFEQALQERERQLRFVTDHAPILIVQCDAGTRFLFVNEPYARRYGLRPEQVVGKRIAEVVGAAAYRSFGRYVDSVLRGERVEFEEKIPYEQLGPLWMHCIYVPEVSGGKVVSFVAVLQNVTARREAEEALRESEERFHLAVRATNDAIWDWDLVTNSAWWSEALEPLFGYTPEQVSHKPSWWHERIHPADHDRVVAGLEHAVTHDQMFWRDEYQFRRADGEYADIFDRGYIVRDSAGKALRMLGAMQDVTERKRAERAVQAAQEELRQHALNLEQTVADRTAHLRQVVAELESVSYSLSHDMRSPVRSIHSFSSILLEDAAARLSPDEQDVLRKIIRSAARLDRLIQDVLIYSRISREKLVMDKIDLEALVRQVIEERPELQPEHAEIYVEKPLPAVRANEAYLTQCITNLLGNAVKFVEPGTRPVVRIRAECADGRLRLWFQDNGIGIPPSAQHRIFGMFERIHAPQAFPGTGIGLAIVKRAVERMNGQVGVLSQPGQGSSFWLDLPLA